MNIIKKPAKDYHQPKITGGNQKVILESTKTGETDELDPKFNKEKDNNHRTNDQKIEPNDDPNIELK